MRFLLLTILFLTFRDTHECRAGFLDALTQLNQNSCIGSSLFSRMPVGIPFYSSMKCEDLLSSEPPSSVANVPGSLFTVGSDTWQPVCSISTLQLYKSLGNPTDIAPLVSLMGRSLKKLDECNTTNDRYGSGFKPASQKQAEVVRAKKSEVEQTKSLFKLLREKAARGCCGADQSCFEQMNSLKVVQCIPQKNKELPDKCTSSGTQYVSDLEPNRVRIDIGFVQISPFADVLRAGDLSHELGHACSYYMRNYSALSSNNTSQNLKGTACDISTNIKAIYDKLFERLNLNKYSTDCFYNFADRALQKRYEKGNCPGGCPLQSLEEGYAEAFSILNTPGSEWNIDVSPFWCAQGRDSRHMLPSDALRCLLKTPAARKVVEKGLGCAP